MADADGTVIETVGEPGQVVSAGQTVVRLAQAGPREAVVALPETIRPAIGSVAEAVVYGSDGRRHTAHLRQRLERTHTALPGFYPIAIRSEGYSFARGITP